jgi:hypothetical protein
MDEILKAISNYGFPIVVSAYLLIRMELKMEQLAQSIRDLAKSIMEGFAKS